MSALATSVRTPADTTTVPIVSRAFEPPPLGVLLFNMGGPGTLEVMGTPFCGKGEPGQVIRVGHAAPACVFREVEVFGAA